MKHSCSTMMFRRLEQVKLSIFILRRSFSSDWQSKDFILNVEKNILDENVWAKSPEATKLMSFVNNSPLSISKAKNIVDYVNERQMHGSSGIDTTCPEFRVLTSILSFPLSLSYGLSKIYAQSTKIDNINVLVVGSRSESSLPIGCWRENLFLESNVINKDIHFIGPGILVNHSFSKAKQSISFKNGELLTSYSLTNNQIRTSMKPTTAANVHNVSDGVKEVRTVDDMNVLHQHPKCAELLLWADVFVLFNPGFGSQALQESWDPTIRLLLSTHKPILCTAHGDHDLRRDLSALDRISSEEDHQEMGDPVEFFLAPHENPFRSHKATLDPQEEPPARVVLGNHSIYAFAMK